MAIPLYDLSIRSYLQTLGAIESVLEKGAAHLRAAGEDLDAFVETRVADDMLPFRFQVVSVVHHSRGAIAGVKAGEFRPPPPSSGDYAGLQALVAEAKASLAAEAPAEIDALEGREVVFILGEHRLPPFTAEGFLMSFSLPNFYFHAATTYGILRRHGVNLGKRDFMGQLRMKT